MSGRFARELGLVAPVYLGLSFINLASKLALTPSWFDGTLARNHQLLLRFAYTNNEQSRLLQFQLPELLRQAFGLSVERAYILQRWAFVFVAFVGFHAYLRRWFDPGWSLAGVVLFAAILPLGHFDDLQESGPLLLVTFLAALWAIREGHTPALLVAYLVGGLNNETMLALPIAFFACEVRGARVAEVARAAGKTLLTSLPLVAIVGAIRYFTRDRPHLGGAWHWPDNLAGIARHLTTHPLDWHRAVYLYGFFVFGALWVYACLRWKDRPPFLRRASVMAPVFVLAHLLTGIVFEVRQMMPLAFLVVPMALFYLRREELASSTEENGATPRLQ